MAIFFDHMKKSLRPTIFGDGKQTRDFIYVGDVVEANVKAFERAGMNAACNIAKGEETSVNELYKLMQKVSGIKLEAEQGEEVQGEVRAIYLDNEKARKELEWKPSISLKDGLKRTWESLESSRDVSQQDA